MRRVAFFAPLKAPDHPVPSGDREMARNLMTAIAAGGAEVTLASTLGLRDGTGDTTRQHALRRAAADEVARLTQAFAPDPPDLWVTYHNYYKAPDLIGPAVCGALDIPYVQIESSRAKRRLTGPWAGFAADAEAAADAAGLIFYLTELDLLTLSRDRAPGQRLVAFPPFLPTDHLPEAATPGADGPILTAAMMRAGDKMASYTLLAEALAALASPDWRLEIAGDGPCRAEVAALFAPFGDRVRWLGELDRAGLAAAYRRASLFVWPGVNEAYGMVYLEAQAAGLPVIAQDRPGVRDVILPGAAPAPEAGPAALAAEIDRHLADPALRGARGAAARARIAERHLIGQATARFWDAIADPGVAA